jgi:glyoxylase-like metal-dependent hydrolase (beta-lactamase superfamily II)
MKMHALSGGRLRMRKSIYLPDAVRQGTIELPVSSFLIRHHHGNVPFDTGCHPSVAEHAEQRWGGMAKLMTPIFGPQENVLTGLQQLGFDPEDVDLVISSHLHPDHCGCNAFFANATILCHRKELEAARKPEVEKAGYLEVEWKHGQIETIDGQRDLFGDDRLILIPLSGHTPGTTGALVTLDRSSQFLLASDTVSLRATLDRDIVPRNTWNPDLLRKSFAEIRRIEAAGATVICGHDAAQWANLRKGADAYD